MAVRKRNRCRSCADRSSWNGSCTGYTAAAVCCAIITTADARVLINAIEALIVQGVLRSEKAASRAIVIVFLGLSISAKYAGRALRLGFSRCAVSVSE